MDIVTYALLKKKIEGVTSGFKGANLDPNDNSKVILHFADNVDIKVEFPGIKPDSFNIDNDGFLILNLGGGISPIQLGKVTGEQGEKGEKGDKGDQGIKGDKGADGKDGYSVTYKSHSHDDSNKITKLILHDEKTDSDITINLPDGQDGANGKDGINGKDGKDGTNGKDGVDGKDGKDGINGKDGIDGKDGKSISVKGTPVHDDINKKTVVVLTDGTTDTTLEIPDGAKGDSGAGTGDMLASEYDATGAVKTAGGISSYITDSLKNYVEKETGKGLSTNDYTDIDKAKVDKLITNDSVGDKYLANDGTYKTITAGEANVIEKIKRNGVDLTISNKAVDISVPTKTSELTNDSNFVADANYVHTDNNYSSADKTKLDKLVEYKAGNGITINGNVIESSISLSDYAKKQDVTNELSLKLNKSTSGNGDKFLADDNTYKTITPGKTYTAGTGIEIDNNDVISTKFDNIVDGTTIKYENGKLVATGGAGTVKSVKINGTAYNPDTNGLVDLGTIAGGTGTITDVTVDGISVVDSNGVADIDLTSYIEKTDLVGSIDDSNKNSIKKIPTIKAVVDYLKWENRLNNQSQKTTTKTVGNLASGTLLNEDYTWQEIVSMMVFGPMDTPILKGSDISDIGYKNTTIEKAFTFDIPTSAGYTTVLADDIAQKVSIDVANYTGTPIVSISNGTVKVTFTGAFYDKGDGTIFNKVSFASGAFKTIGDGQAYSGEELSEAFEVKVAVTLRAVPVPTYRNGYYSKADCTATFDLQGIVNGMTVLNTDKISVITPNDGSTLAVLDGTPELNGNSLTVKIKSGVTGQGLNGKYDIKVDAGALVNTGNGEFYKNETKQNVLFTFECNHPGENIPADDPWTNDPNVSDLYITPIDEPFTLDKNGMPVLDMKFMLGKYFDDDSYTNEKFENHKVEVYWLGRQGLQGGTPGNEKLTYDCKIPSVYEYNNGIRMENLRDKEVFDASKIKWRVDDDMGEICLIPSEAYHLSLKPSWYAVVVYK